MIVPYKVDVPMQRWPIANFVLIGSTVVAFVLQISVMMSSSADAIEPFVLGTGSPLGLVGHIWLHGGIMHLLGNMLFLWVFGNAICAKIGNAQFVGLYVALGVLAGLCHLTFGGGPAVGASGAINGIVGMFLVLYPLNHVTCALIWFPFVRTFSVSSYWLIVMWFVFDILGVLLGAAGVAFYAHIGGFLAGFAVAAASLKLGWIRPGRYERSLLDVLSGKGKPQSTHLGRWRR